jgi:hypothetical protein
MAFSLYHISFKADIWTLRLSSMSFGGGLNTQYRLKLFLCLTRTIKLRNYTYRPLDFRDRPRYGLERGDFESEQ